MVKHKLYIHIGTHKTGSTTLQNILEKEKKQLLNEGIFYLGRFRDIAKPMKGITKYDETLVEKFRKEVEKKIENSNQSSPHTFLASNEKWSGHDMLAYRNASVNARMLWDIFSPYGFAIKLIVYLRRQDKFYESAYSQKVKRGATYTFQEFLTEVDDIKDCHWDTFLDSYADYFGHNNIIVQPFDKQHLPHKDSLIHSFGRIIDSDLLMNYSLEGIKNNGYTKDLIEIARLSNGYLTEGEIRILKYILTEVTLSKKHYSYFSTEQKKRLLDHFEESNNRVLQKYLSDNYSSLFSITDIGDDNSQKTYDGLTTEAMAVAFAKILVVLHKQLLGSVKESRKMLFSKRVKRTLKRLIRKIQ